MKLISNEVTNKDTYGIIKIQTDLGELIYSYRISLNDINYELENRPREKMTDEISDEIDDLITKELKL